MDGIVLDAMGEKEYTWLEQGLTGIGFFSKLGRKHLAGVLPCITLVEFEKGAVVCSEGDPGDSFFLIYEGGVEVTKRGWDKPVAALKPGEFFGEMALLFGQPRAATVRTTKPSRLFALHAEDFNRLLKKSPTVARTLQIVAEARRKELAQA